MPVISWKLDTGRFLSGLFLIATGLTGNLILLVGAGLAIWFSFSVKFHRK